MPPIQNIDSGTPPRLGPARTVVRWYTALSLSSELRGMHPRTKIHDIGVGRLAVRRKPGRRMARPLDTRLSNQGQREPSLLGIGQLAPTLHLHAYRFDSSTDSGSHGRGDVRDPLDNRGPHIDRVRIRRGALLDLLGFPPEKRICRSLRELGRGHERRPAALRITVDIRAGHDERPDEMGVSPVGGDGERQVEAPGGDVRAECGKIALLCHAVELVDVCARGRRVGQPSPPQVLSNRTLPAHSSSSPDSFR